MLMKKLIFFCFVFFCFLGIAFFWWKDAYFKKLKSMPELKNFYPQLKSPQSGTVLMIFAHSDDELGVIAQIKKLKEQNPMLKIKWYIVSDGSQGFIFPGACGEMTNQQCRMKEAQKVSDCAQISLPINLGLLDGSLSQMSDLSLFLQEKIPELHQEDLDLVFTHDNRGLYGHPDHIAVYNAVKKILMEREVALVSMALPEYFKKRLPVLEHVSHLESFPITHGLELLPDDIKAKSCAIKAYKSQRHVLDFMMLQGLSAEEFLQAVPREFMNVSLPKEI